MKVLLGVLAGFTLCLFHTATAGRVVCYYGSWATYRPGNGRFNPEDIDADLCTHIVYGFIGLDEQTSKVKSLNPDVDLEENWGKGNMKRFNNLRNANPELKTMVAIGGWNEGSTKYSAMAASQQNRKTFVESAVNFVLTYGFNGLDIDWEYPTQRGGSPSDRQNYVSLIKELREEFSQHGLLLSAAVAAGQYTVDAAYDVPALSRYLDFINVMTYDFHGGWESATGHNAPLYERPDESPDNRLMNVNASIHHWIELGAAPSKLNLGMGMYGHTFTLLNAANNGLYAPVTGPGRQGPYTQEGGTLGYNEICESLKQNQWTVIQDTYYKSPYAYHENQWVGYDDEDSIRAKSQFAVSLGLGGGMIWSIETDDFRGICGKKYPLLSVIHEVFSGSETPQPQPAPQPAPAPEPHPQPPPAPQPQLPPAPQPSQYSDYPEQFAIQQCSIKSHLVRHPNDCSKFYYCQKADASYVVFEKSCPLGLLFDTSINACNWKYLVKDC